MAYNNTYVALDKVTISGTSTATVTFSAIPSTYTDLIIVGNLGSESTNAFPYLQFNGDTGNNYSFTQVYGTGSATYSSRVSNTNQLFNSDVSVKQSSLNSNVIYQIINYSNSTTYKTALSRQNTVDAADYNGALAAVGSWRNTAAITSVSIKLTRGGTAYNFSNGSTFSLYGIAATGSNPTAKATGGTITFGSDGYTYHTFTSSGTFTPSVALSCEVMSVGGGGAGAQGGGGGGGGGAGELDLFTTQSLTATGYTVTVGAGGSAATPTAPTNGGPSSFGSLVTSLGGGRGGSQLVAGQTGGSGGGGSNDSTSGGGASGSNTNIGGTGYGYPPGTAGGGGGATQAGFNANKNSAGNGGEGYPLASISPVVAAICSPMTVIASGGGGGVQLGGTTATAGTGGTGAGNGGKDGVSATAPTSYGSGGGGSSAQTVSNPSAGYQGVVIVRYASV